MIRTFTPDEIAALIAKLEAATGADRDLDCAIGVTIGAFTPYPPKYEGAGVRFARICSDGSHALPGQAPDMLVPDFTSSIDAALSLVPDDHDWALHSDNGEAIAGCMPASEDGCDCSDSHGATPAIALVIAALKARASIREVEK